MPKYQLNLIEPESRSPEWNPRRIFQPEDGEPNKNNLIIEDVGAEPKYESLHVKRSDAGRISEQEMLREARALQRLATTGMTPLLQGLFRVGTRELHLVTTTVPGKSPDRMNAEEKALLTKKIEPAIVQALQFVKEMHTHGLFNTDINPGSFVIDGIKPEQELRISFVDFQYAREINDCVTEPIGRSRAKMTYEQFDPAVATYNGTNEELFTSENLYRMDQFWTLVELLNNTLGHPTTEHFDALPEKDRAALSKVLERYDKNGLQSNYDYASGISGIIMHWTLPLQLKELGIEIDKGLLEYVQAALHPDIEKRPVPL